MQPTFFNEKEYREKRGLRLPWKKQLMIGAKQKRERVATGSSLDRHQQLLIIIEQPFR